MIGKFIWQLISDEIMPAEITVAPDRCLNSRRSFNCCRRCLEVCPGQAVKLKDNGIPAVLAGCQGCGRCAALCPAAALSYKGRGWQKINNRLILAARTRDEILSVCSTIKTGHPAEVVTGCPAAFNLARLFIFPALDCRAVFPLAACRENNCSNYLQAESSLKAKSEYISRFYTACRDYFQFILTPEELENQAAFTADGAADSAEKSKISEAEIKGKVFQSKTDSQGTNFEFKKQNFQGRKNDEHQQQINLSRRELFTTLDRKGRAISRDFLQAGREELLQKIIYLGEEREELYPPRFLQLLLKQCRKSSHLGLNQRAIFAAGPEVDSRVCSCCQLCEKFCPTGAIKFQGQELIYLPGKCQVCRICQRKCPEKALEFTRGLTAADFIQESVAANPGFVLESCPSCGTSYNKLSGRKSCYFCS